MEDKEKENDIEEAENSTQLLLFFREPSRESSLKRLIPLMCEVMRFVGWGVGDSYSNSGAIIGRLMGNQPNCARPLGTGQRAEQRQITVTMPTTLIGWSQLEARDTQHDSRRGTGTQNRTGPEGVCTHTEGVGVSLYMVDWLIEGDQLAWVRWMVTRLKVKSQAIISSSWLRIMIYDSYEEASLCQLKRSSRSLLWHSSRPLAWRERLKDALKCH